MAIKKDNITWKQIKDTFNDIEILEGSKLDSSYKDKYILFTSTIRDCHDNLGEDKRIRVGLVALDKDSNPVIIEQDIFNSSRVELFCLFPTPNMVY